MYILYLSPFLNYCAVLIKLSLLTGALGIRMQNHKCNEVENAFLIFKVSRIVRVHTVHITIVITK